MAIFWIIRALLNWCRCCLYDFFCRWPVENRSTFKFENEIAWSCISRKNCLSLGIINTSHILEDFIWTNCNLRYEVFESSYDFWSECHSRRYTDTLGLYRRRYTRWRWRLHHTRLSRIDKTTEDDQCDDKESENGRKNTHIHTSRFWYLGCDCFWYEIFCKVRDWFCFFWYSFFYNRRNYFRCC